MFELFSRRWHHFAKTKIKIHELARSEKRYCRRTFLSRMSHRHVEIIASCARRTHLEEAKILFREGETVNRFYLIEKGGVDLVVATKAGERRVVAGRIGPGGVLAWSWLFPPYAWQITTRAGLSLIDGEPAINTGPA